MAKMPATSGTDARSGPEKRPMKMPRMPQRVMNRWPDLDPDPIGQPVAAGGADRPRDPDRPEADPARSDQIADADQRSPGRNEQRDEGERFTKGEAEDDRCRPGLVDAHELDQLMGVGFEVCKHSGEFTRVNGLLPRSRP